MAISIPKVSNQSKSLNKKTTLIAKAINKILIMGSPSDSINKRKKPSCLRLVISLVPYFLRDAVTCCSVKPLLKLFSILSSKTIYEKKDNFSTKKSTFS